MSHLGTRGDISKEHGDNVTEHKDATEGGDNADGKASPQIVNNNVLQQHSNNVRPNMGYTCLL